MVTHKIRAVRTKEAKIAPIAGSGPEDPVEETKEAVEQLMTSGGEDTLSARLEHEHHPTSFRKTSENTQRNTEGPH